MTYRVAFAKRFQSDGNESVLDPTSELDVYIPDGVVADKVFVERFDPEAKHNQEVLDEDDAFLGSAAAEIWEYDVVDERAAEFEDAIGNSNVVMEFQIVDETSTEQSEVVGNPLAEGKYTGEGEAEGATDETRGGSGVRSIDDGPGGQPTGDPSAGGLGVGQPYLGLDQMDGIANEGAGGLEDLTIVSADDPSLGLTNVGDVGPDDWAADVGPTRIPDRGVASTDLNDTESTLGPDRGDPDPDRDPGKPR